VHCNWILARNTLYNTTAQVEEKAENLTDGSDGMRKTEVAFRLRLEVTSLRKNGDTEQREKGHVVKEIRRVDDNIESSVGSKVNKTHQKVHQNRDIDVTNRCSL
jgi:hypothetical protein